MADRDVEQAADLAADGLRELPEQLAEAWCHDPGHHWSVHLPEVEVFLPVVEAYAAAKVAAERERCIAAVQALYRPGRPADGTYDEPSQPSEWDEALYEAAQDIQDAP